MEESGANGVGWGVRSVGSELGRDEEGWLKGYGDSERERGREGTGGVVRGETIPSLAPDRPTPTPFPLT